MRRRVTSVHFGLKKRRRKKKKKKKKKYEGDERLLFGCGGVLGWETAAFVALVLAATDANDVINFEEGNVEHQIRSSSRAFAEEFVSRFEEKARELACDRREQAASECWRWRGRGGGSRGASWSQASER